MGIADKIRAIEEELKRTQVHKGTEYHVGLLKAKLAKYKRELAASGARKGGGGFSVRKGGDSTVAIIGFPSVGKSTLLNALTNARSEVAPYAFTTVSVVPGMLIYKGARIQLLDLPGILEAASKGAGKGREVIGVARSADLILILLDALQPDALFTIRRELEAMAIRLDRQPPKVVVTPKERGGIVITSTVKLTKLDERMIKDILAVFNMHNCEIVFREDAGADELIDVLAGNRVYVPSLVVVNKADLADQHALSELRSRLPSDSILISAEKGIGLEALRAAIYNRLRFIRVYMKPKGGEADLREPMILRDGSTVEDVCDRIHRGLRAAFRHALVWGPSAKFPGQKVGLDHALKDEDIVSIVSR
ncbi:MAG: GTP-binding protein [Candidatus Micrarchaeia archaeon]